MNRTRTRSRLHRLFAEIIRENGNEQHESIFYDILNYGNMEALDAFDLMVRAKEYIYDVDEIDEEVPLDVRESSRTHYVLYVILNKLAGNTENDWESGDSNELFDELLDSVLLDLRRAYGVVRLEQIQNIGEAEILSFFVMIEEIDRDTIDLYQSLFNDIREVGSAYASRYAMNHERGRIRSVFRLYGNRHDMENFITNALDLEIRMHPRALDMISDEDMTDYIIELATNKLGNEFAFTPDIVTDYQELQAIYDKVAADLQKMILTRLGKKQVLYRPERTDALIDEINPGVEFNDVHMKFGDKLLAIEKYLENKAKTEAKGTKRRKVRKTRNVRNLRKVSKRRKNTRR